MERQSYNRDLQAKYFIQRKKWNRTVKQRKKDYKRELISNLHDALNKDLQRFGIFLENMQGESQCLVSARKWLTHLENLISADVNSGHERKRQIETEHMNAMNGTTSTFLDCPIINPEILQASRTLKNRKTSGKDDIANEIIRASVP